MKLHPTPISYRVELIFSDDVTYFVGQNGDKEEPQLWLWRWCHKYINEKVQDITRKQQSAKEWVKSVTDLHYAIVIVVYICICLCPCLQYNMSVHTKKITFSWLWYYQGIVANMLINMNIGELSHGTCPYLL